MVFVRCLFSDGTRRRKWNVVLVQREVHCWVIIISLSVHYCWQPKGAFRSPPSSCLHLGYKSGIKGEMYPRDEKNESLRVWGKGNLLNWITFLRTNQAVLEKREIWNRLKERMCNWRECSSEFLFDILEVLKSFPTLSKLKHDLILCQSEALLAFFWEEVGNDL